MGGNASTNLTTRSIINRGGEQGAQHSQSLHSWLSHIQGLIVLMPSTVQDAYDLLISGVKSGNLIVYIDDRWLYDLEASLNQEKYKKINIFNTKKIKKRRRSFHNRLSDMVQKLQLNYQNL